MDRVSRNMELSFFFSLDVWMMMGNGGGRQENDRLHTARARDDA